MTLWQKRALLSALIWGIVAAGFLVCFLSGYGPSAFIEGNPRRNIGAAFLAAGILSYTLLLYFTKKRRKARPVLVDERDQTLSRKASEGAFFVLALFVFLFSIALHDAFRDKGSVPIGWLWSLAYSSWILAYLSQAVIALIFYSRMSSHGEG
ncbi:MAG: DUF2178 domain-containing protein [bacterium]|nr:MAG: DUF2178 domain-containing protein [bacterium]